VYAPKHFQDLLVGGDGGIVVDLGHLSMSGSAAANFFVCGVFDLTIGIARFYVDDAIHLTVNRVEAPKAAAGEYARVDGLFGILIHGLGDGVA
jgi:hypothetical protein